MIRSIRFLLVLFGIILLGFFVIGIAQKPDWSIVETIEIKRSPEVINDQIMEWEQWSNWFQWSNEDSTETRGIEGLPESEMLFYSEGNKQGNFSYLKRESQSLHIQAQVFTPDHIKWNSELKLIKTDSSTIVIWKNKGKRTFAQRCMSLFLDIDYRLRPHFKENLENLKSHCELSTPENKHKRIEQVNYSLLGKRYINRFDSASIQKSFTEIKGVFPSLSQSYSILIEKTHSDSVLLLFFINQAVYQSDSAMQAQDRLPQINFQNQLEIDWEKAEKLLNDGTSKLLIKTDSSDYSKWSILHLHE